MAIYRMQCSWMFDSAFPRDRVTINPHFEDTEGFITDNDADGLCQQLAAALNTWSPTPAELRVKAYVAGATPPNTPVGEGVVNEGVVFTSPMPREVALCLSYYSGSNAPRRRGRLYIPAYLVSSSPTLGLRPNTTATGNALSLGGVMKNLGGADIDWVVYSRIDNDARPVSNYWVDDEWDTVRSRGLRSTTRVVGTASE